MQDLPRRDAADARVSALAGKRLWQVAVFGAALTVILTLSMLSTAFLTTSETGTRALDMDFRVFWAVARLALQGEALASFDMTRLSLEHGYSAERWMPWVYPPGYLILIAPFGAFSFATAFLLSTLLSLAAIALALRTFVAGNAGVWLALALSPAYIAALVIGQNSLLWLACLLTALAALRDGRWVLAGVLIGCLTLKPQLGVMILVALLAAGLWRTILAASVTAILLAVVPTLFVGIEYWPLFLDRMSEQGSRMLAAIGTTDLMIGSYYLMVRLGLAAETALFLQIGLAVAAALAVVLVWRSPKVGFDAKVATLLTAIYLSAPYLWYYEGALMALTGLFLFRAGLLGQTATQLGVLGLFWLGAGVQAICVFLGVEVGRFPWALIYVCLMLLSLGLCLAHYAALRRSAPETA